MSRRSHAGCSRFRGINKNPGKIILSVEAVEKIGSWRDNIGSVSGKPMDCYMYIWRSFNRSSKEKLHPVGYCNVYF